MEDMRKNTVAGLIVEVALCLSLTACQDTKVRQENEQLNAQVLELQKGLVSGGIVSVDEATKAHDGLMKGRAQDDGAKA
jgi:hypothetical protein